MICNLVFLFGFLGLAFYGVDSDFFVILLQSSEILTSFGEFTFFHTFTDVPVDESSLGVHKIELMIQTSPCLSDSCSVAQHADSALDFSKIATRYNGGWLVVDSDLETSWAPIDELNGSLGLDGCNGCVDILGNNITAVQHAASHVFPMAGVALHHLVGWFKASVGDLGNGKLLVVRLLSGDDRGIGDQGEVNSWVGDQVGLELGQIHVQGTVEAKGGGDRGYDLADETVEIGVGWPFDVEISAADVVDGLVVDHEGTVRVLQGCVGSQDGVVRFYNSSRDLRGGIDGELQFGLLSVIH